MSTRSGFDLCFLHSLDIRTMITLADQRDAFLEISIRFAPAQHDNRAAQNAPASSIVLRAVENPGPDVPTEAVRQWLVSIGHSYFGRDLRSHKHDKIAGVGLTWNDHGPEFSTLHQPLISRQV